MGIGEWDENGKGNSEVKQTLSSSWISPGGQERTSTSRLTVMPAATGAGL